MIQGYSPPVGDRLRPLWDFGDLDASERRFFDQLARETTAEGRAEVLTQLARVEGLRGRFDRGDALLVEAEALGTSGAAVFRIPLERGRLLRSGGDPAAALPLFESSFTLALEAGESFIAADAAHMAALAAPDREGMLEWTQRGIDLARSDEDAYWLGPLLNNLGWAHYEDGEYDAALDAFERALRARERDPERRAEIEIARYAVGKTLRALGRPEEAATLLEQAVAWDESDGWFHEELAQGYAALGRDDEAREQARLALPLLLGADPDVRRRRGASHKAAPTRRRRLTCLSAPGGYLHRLKPPSELIVWPVIQRASSLQIQAISRAASSGSPQRPNGIVRAGSWSARPQPVSVGPGLTVLTVIRRSASASASVSVACCIAPFETA